MTTPNFGAEADVCAVRGWHVFPCNPKNKKPLTENGFKDATCDRTIIKRWWTQWPTAMIGVRTGPESGIFVLDLDLDPDKNFNGIAAFEGLKNGAEVPETITIQTPRGGQHLWFRWVDGISNSASKLAPGIDVRGAGGYAIAPPSRRSDGKEYQFLVDQSEPAEAPEWLLKLLLPTPNPRKGKASAGNGASDDSYARTALERECTGVARARPGGRNGALNKAAFSLGQLVAGGLLNRTEVRHRLYSAAISCGLVKDDGRKQAEATIDSGLDAGMAKPRRAPARKPKPSLPEEPEPAPAPEPEPVPKRSLDQVHEVFQKSFGTKFDMTTLDAVLAVTAAAKLGGDPAWLLVISGSGNAKTETVSSVIALPGAHVISTISSEGALLSATTKKSRTKGATGGLLRKVGSRGILVIKDFTSILSIDYRVRTAIIAALREIHDGRWERNVGTDGGQTLSWMGHLIIIGACTTAWDQAHAVIASMGDRFVLIRSDSHLGRIEAGQHAIKNTGAEVTIRKEMADAVTGLISNIGPLHPRDLKLQNDEMDCILKAADIVTLARTGVETDYRGDVIDVHMPEMPTRFAKQLTQIMRGGLAIGMARRDALALALRCARDSVPQLRLAVLLDLKMHDESGVREVRQRLQKPYRTINRVLEALHSLDLIVCREVDPDEDDDKRSKPTQLYVLTTDTFIALDALNPTP